MNLISSYKSEFESILRVWLGAYKFGNTWNFTSGEPVSYTDWEGGDPNEAGDACAYYYGNMAANYFFPWHDQDCHDESNKFHFLCEEN